MDLSHVDLVALIAQDLGPGSTQGAWTKWVCPFHNDNDPSLGARNDGHTGKGIYKCFGCDAHGDAVDWLEEYRNMTKRDAVNHLDISMTPPTAEQLDQRNREQMARAMAQLQVVQAKLRKLRENGAWLRYHLEMPETARAWWTSQGIPPAWQNHYNLGYCPSRWVAEGLTSPSYTIPYHHPGDCQIVNIQHRLADVPKQYGKYRWHKKDLPVMLYDTQPGQGKPDTVLVVEGAKKAIVTFAFLDKKIRVVGLPQKTVSDQQIEPLQGISRVYLALDPDALVNGEAYTVAERIGRNTRVISIPVKPDDFFTLHGGTPAQFWAYIKQGVPL